MDRHLSPHPHLRLVVEPTRAAQHAWYARAEHDARTFLLRHGHSLSDPSLTHWVVEQCAELIWQWRPEQPSWSALRVDEIWRSLDTLHRFFPLPRLVIAYYETLSAFLPWLCSRGQLDREACATQLDALELVRSPMLEQARAQLSARALRTHGRRR